MALFAKRSAEPESETSRSYLAKAPPGPRTELLVGAVYQQFRELPVAQSSELRGLPPFTDVSAGGELVSQLLAQDQSLSVQVARKTAVFTRQLVSLLPGTMSGAIDIYWAANGIRWTDGEATVLESAKEPPPTTEGSLAIANMYEALQTAVILGPKEAPRGDWDMYVKLHIESKLPDTRTMLHELTAWAAIAAARLLNAEQFDLTKANMTFPVFDSRYRNVVPLSVPGWYPNPMKNPEIIAGDAGNQRYWDGNDWTERARYREGRKWTSVVYPLDAAPVD